MRAHENFGSARAQEFETKHNVILESFQYQFLRSKKWWEENIARYRISLKWSVPQNGRSSSTCTKLDIFVEQIMLHKRNLNISG